MVARLRLAGIPAIIASGSKGLKSQLKQANSLRLPHVVIIGDEEIKNDTVILRDMAKGEQTSLRLDEALARLQERP
jgi:histidyl-tRNA synthetase